jgi:hypothetical protein
MHASKERATIGIDVGVSGEGVVMRNILMRNITTVVAALIFAAAVASLAFARGGGHGGGGHGGGHVSGAHGWGGGHVAAVRMPAAHFYARPAYVSHNGAPHSVTLNYANANRVYPRFRTAHVQRPFFVGSYGAGYGYDWDTGYFADNVGYTYDAGGDGCMMLTPTGWAVVC